MINSLSIQLDQVSSLQSEVEAAWTDGVRSFELTGRYVADQEADHLLKVTKFLSGIVLRGRGAILDGNGHVNHVVVVEDAVADLTGVTITGGTTVGSSRVARRYAGRRLRSIYEHIDGAGLLALGTADILLSQCAFVENHSGMCGGAISNQTTGMIEVKQCQFRDNTAFHTGAAIDNLIPGAQLLVGRSSFENNRSNIGSLLGGPHGQITVFGKTKAEVRDCDFSGGSFPIDVSSKGEFEDENNTWDGAAYQVRRPGWHVGPLALARHVVRLGSYEARLLRHGAYPWISRS